MPNATTEQKTAVIVVDEVKRIDGKGALKGFAKVTIGGKVTIHSLRVIQQTGKPPWISLPQSEVRSNDGGKSKWYPIVEIHDESLRKRIFDAVLDAYQRQE